MKPTNKQCPKCGSYNTARGLVGLGVIIVGCILNFIGLFITPLLLIGLPLFVIGCIMCIYELFRKGNSYQCKQCKRYFRI